MMSRGNVAGRHQLLVCKILSSSTPLGKAKGNQLPIGKAKGSPMLMGNTGNSQLSLGKVDQA